MLKSPIKKYPTRAARNLLVVLVVVELVMGVLYVITQQADLAPFWIRLFNLDSEFSLSSTLTSALFLSVGLAALASNFHRREQSRWQRIYWLIFGAAFIFLGLDEYFVIHESDLLLRWWLRLYTSAGVALGLITLATFWFSYRTEKGLFILILGGMGIMALGGLGFEALNWLFFCSSERGISPLCHSTGVIALEEVFEMIGLSILLAGVISYGQVRLKRGGWRRAVYLIAGVSSIWIAVLFANIWVLPGLEARYLAESARTEWFDGALSLIGYETSHERVIAPGDTLTVKMFWRTNQVIPADYFLSVHVLGTPEIESFASQDAPMGGWLKWPTSTWFPGIVMRDVVRLEVPEDLPPQGDYWLIVRVWLPTETRPVDWEAGEKVAITSTDRELFEPFSVILLNLMSSPTSA